MAKTYREDLTGRIFDCVKVIGWNEELSKNSSKNQWDCECTCEYRGKRVISTDNLKSNRKITCICNKRTDFTGRIYNDVKVVSLDSERTTKKYRYWLVECVKCGSCKSISTGNLNAGKGTTCGPTCDIDRNEYTNLNDGRTIVTLSDGTECMIDTECYEMLKGSTWGLNCHNYAMGRVAGVAWSMHRYILGITNPEIHITHIDGNTLNNVKSNLKGYTSQKTMARLIELSDGNLDRFKNSDQNNVYNYDCEIKGNEYIWVSKGLVKMIINDIEILIDAEDYDEVSKYTWYMSGDGYPRSSTMGYSIYLHRVIMRNEDPELCVDHIDGNPYNNMKYNLRMCTVSQNRGNVHSHKYNTSGFSGVVLPTGENRTYAARIGHHEIVRCATYEEAVCKSVRLQQKYYGEFAQQIKDPKILEILKEHDPDCCRTVMWKIPLKKAMEYIE